ncbi:hypothetical protein [Alienimonas californiensis]|uniref:hypothetical protein n=1 Tax=Alienimonas californiensis TaxID=2527989 RepID=UPI0013FCF822
MKRAFGWLGRSQRLARDYERLAETLACYHWLAFAGLLLCLIIRNFLARYRPAHLAGR